MTNKEEAIEYLKWIRPIRPYSLDKIKVQESIDLAIKALEERPQGEWIADDAWGNCHCSKCGEENNHMPKYCEKCGAKMKNGE